MCLRFSFMFSSFLSPPLLKKNYPCASIMLCPPTSVVSTVGVIAKTWWREASKQIDGPQTSLVVLASSQSICLDAVYYRQESIHHAVPWTQALKYNNNFSWTNFTSRWTLETLAKLMMWFGAANFHFLLHLQGGWRLRIVLLWQKFNLFCISKVKSGNDISISNMNDLDLVPTRCFLLFLNE